MSRRPGGRTNGAGRGPRMPRPRGTNRGPTRGGCGIVAIAFAGLPVLGALRLRHLAAALLLTVIFGWMLEATWGPGPCEPRELRPAVTR